MINPAGFNFARLDEEVEKQMLPFRQRVLAKGLPFYVVLAYVDFDTAPGSTFEHANNPAEYAEYISQCSSISGRSTASSRTPST